MLLKRVQHLNIALFPRVSSQTMSKSRLAKRREVEAAESAETTSAKKKTTTRKRKKADDDGAAPVKKKRTTRARTKKAKEALARRRLVWVVYSSTMREEGRYLYFERAQAEEKLEQLLSKGKRKYFIQPIKEALNPDGTPVVASEMTIADEPPEEVKPPAAAKDEDAADDASDEDADIDPDLAADGDDDADPPEPDTVES